MIIAFCGLDGSGKTTQAQKLTHYLNKKGERSVCINWMSCYPMCVRRTSFLLKNRTHFQEQSSPSSSFIILAGRLSVVFFNAFCVSIKIGWSFLQRENIVLDRYILDDLVHLRYRGLNKRVFLFLLKLIPVSGRIFYLQIAPQEAQSRESGGKHQFAYFQKKYILYERVAQLKKIKKIEIHRAVSEEEIFEEILKNLV